MLRPVDLIRLSLEIENRVAANGDLIPLPGKGSTLLTVALHRDGCCVHFRCDMPAELRRQVVSLGPQALLADPARVQGLLGQHAACSRVWAGEGYYFAQPPQPEEYPDVLKLGDAYVVIVAGEAVSRAQTQDGSSQAAELALETREAYRRRGYGRQAASAWAAAIIGEGKVAFYSHLAGNAASQRLARSLGVVWYARWAGYAA